MRIRESLRIFLETFRLPGEAPLISLVMEHFSQHWRVNSNPRSISNSFNNSLFKRNRIIINLKMMMQRLH